MQNHGPGGTAVFSLKRLMRAVVPCPVEVDCPTNERGVLPVVHVILRSSSEVFVVVFFFFFLNWDWLRATKFFILPRKDFLFVCLFVCFHLFIYGCVGSSFLCAGFLQLRRVGATLHHGAQASHCRGLSCCGAQAPDAQAQ